MGKKPPLRMVIEIVAGIAGEQKLQKKRKPNNQRLLESFFSFCLWNVPVWNDRHLYNKEQGNNFFRCCCT